MNLPSDASPQASLLRRWLPFAALALAAAAVVLSGLHRHLSLEAIALDKGRLEAFAAGHGLLALAAYMATYVAVIALSIPGSLLMTVVGGILFPLWICAPAVIVSATAGATILFLIARSSLGEALRRRGGPAMARLAEGLRADAAAYLLFLRFVPLFPFALVNLAPAIVGVPLRTFVWTTFVGVMPASLAFSLAATSLDGILDERVAALRACRAAGGADCALGLDLGLLVDPKLMTAFAALGLLALVPVLARRLLRRRRPSHG